MPAAIPLVVGLGATGAAGAAAAAGTGTILGLTAGAWSAIGVGLSVAGTLAQTLLAETPAKPKMQDGDVSIKQAIPPRVRGYGRQRVGGTFLFYDSTPDGDLKTLVCHVAHEIDAWEEDWLNDERVTLDEDGNVTDDPWWQAGDDDSVVVIQHYLGAPDQVIPSFDEKWTAEHLGHGLCCAYVKYADLKDEEQIKTFPSGPPPYRAVLRLAKIYDPRDVAQDIEDEATWAWSDNAALVLLDYMTRMEQGVPVGFGIPFARVDLATFAAAADVCDQEIPIKIEGVVAGVEPRWRSWGLYELTEDKKAVLQDLLDACGGRLIQGPDGKLGLTVGAGPYRAMDEDPFTVPTGVPAASVTLTEEHILEWDMNQGKPAIERINEVRATYVSQAWEWAETEAGIQEDVAGQIRNGVESSQVKLRFVPSESQAQRVAREVLRRGNPSHAGRIRTTLAGLDAWGERWIHLVIPEMDIDALFEITSMSLNQADMTVSMEVASYDDWWTWTAETDEQAPAVPPPNSDDDAEVPVPENVAVSIVHRLVNGQTYVAVGLITWDPPPRSVYVAKARYRPVSPPNSPWQPLPVAQDDDQVETFPLEDGVAYEAQVRFIGPRGAGSDWSASANFTAVADPVAPASPTGLTAQANTPTVGQVTVSATQPNDPRAATLRFYRNATNTFVGATILAGMPLYAGPGQSRSVVESPGVGDWWYFATSSNWSSVASAPTGGVLAEVLPPPVTILAPTNPTTTNDNKLPVSGNGATAGASIKLYANAVQVGTSTAAGDGTWSVPPSTAYGNGVNALTATQTVGGNESAAIGAVSLTVNALDTDARVYIDAMTVRPSSARMGDIGTLVVALKTAGVWTKLDALYLLAAHDAQAARLNAKAPATFALTATSSPVFTADRGYKGTGLGSTVGGYLASTFNPSTAGGAYALNSAHLGVHVRTASTSTTNAQAGDIGTSGAAIYSKSATAGTISSFLNDGTVSTTAAGTPNNVGHYLLSRTVNTGYAKHHEGTAQASSPVVSTALPNFNFSVLRAGGGAYSDAEVSAAHWGSGLTATEAGDLYTAMHAYLVAVGAA